MQRYQRHMYMECIQSIDFGWRNNKLCKAPETYKTNKVHPVHMTTKSPESHQDIEHPPSHRKHSQSYAKVYIFLHHFCDANFVLRPKSIETHHAGHSKCPSYSEKKNNRKTTDSRLMVDYNGSRIQNLRQMAHTRHEYHYSSFVIIIIIIIIMMGKFKFIDLNNEHMLKSNILRHSIGLMLEFYYWYSAFG